MDAVKFIEERNRMCGTMSEVWTVFLTHEEAEKALEAMKK
jgi:hypothetical protein